MIAKYNGEFMQNNAYRSRYKNIYGPYALSNKLLNDGPYSIYFNETHTIDSACMRGTASLINHKKRRNGANARFSSRDNGIFVYAKRDVRQNEEIFADYGDNYSFKNNFKIN